MVNWTKTDTYDDLRYPCFCLDGEDDYLRELPYDWEPDPSYCRYYDYYNFTRQPAEGYTNLEGAVYNAANPYHVDAPFYTNHDMDSNAEYYRDDNGSAVKMAYALNLLMSGNAFVLYRFIRCRQLLYHADVLQKLQGVRVIGNTL